MRLYHGGLLKVEKPQLIEPSNLRTCDFGSGFYTTTDLEQARRWAKIRQTRDRVSTGHVSIYEVSEDLLEAADLKRLIFTSASTEWLSFVMSNRTNRAFNHNYDLVAGPVANDRVYATLTLFETEQLSIEETVHRLKTYTLVNQVLFHTEKALQKLKYLASEEI